MRSTKCGGQTPAWKRISALSIGIIWRRQTPRKMQLGMKSPIATSTKRAEWQTIAGARQISGFNLHCVPRAPVGCIRDFKSNYSRGRELYLPSGRAFSVFLFFSLSLLKSECPIYIFHKNWFQLKCPRRLPVPKGIYAWRWPLRPAVDWISFFLFYFQYVDVESVVKINKLSRSALLLFCVGSIPFLPQCPWDSIRFFFLVFEPPHQPSLHTQRKKKRLRQSIESDRKMGQQKKSIYDSAPLTHRATGHYLLFFFLFSYVPFPCWCMRAHTQQSKLGRWRIKSLTTPEQKERNRQSGKGSLSEPQGEIITKQL